MKDTSFPANQHVISKEANKMNSRDTHNYDAFPSGFDKLRELHK